MLNRRDALWLSASLVPVCASRGHAATSTDLTRIFKPGEKPTDARLGPPKTLGGYFPFTPPRSLAEWTKRRQELREQVLVSQGLWPLPEKTPLHPVIHGKIDRDGYTVEKVYFAAMPGHYVSGNLYRPTAPTPGKRPAVLSPHGHWANGRLYEAPEGTISRDLGLKAETEREAARYPIQARCANLAKLGFVVFHHDMVGYAESSAIPHSEGFKDVAAELRLQSFMGLQTWNCIRALDFLESLPEVDPKRIGVTGASGGGTQTFLLGAVDDRPAALFPAVMVSTAMQGGCVCENCSYLRVDTGNIELAGLFAPKPLAMSGANDWTREILTKGFPELKQLYKMYDAEQNVAAEAWVQFPHNYSRPSREFMYAWFSEHLLGKPGKVTEQKFVPVPPQELRVYDAQHPRPQDERSAEKLRLVMTETSDAQIARILPKENDQQLHADFRKIVGTALRVMITDSLPAVVAVRTALPDSKIGNLPLHRAVLGRVNGQDAIPVAGVGGPIREGKPAVLWLHPDGKSSLIENGKPAAAVEKLVDAGVRVLAPDLFGSGELPLPDSTAAKPQHGHVFGGYVYGYNRTVLANRVHDTLTAIAYLKSALHGNHIAIVGWGAFGPVAILASALAGEAVTKTAADIHQFRFDAITKLDDPMMLPGAVKYGGLGAFLALCAPRPTLVWNHAGTGIGKTAKAAYAATGAKDHLTLQKGGMIPEDVVKWILG
ncbi:MAG: acetylxylan esterase [Bacteroidales bacterium]|nr:acetylxylan esterase [Bacteroidales bacterium]